MTHVGYPYPRWALNPACQVFAVLAIDVIKCYDPLLQIDPMLYSMHESIIHVYLPIPPLEWNADNMFGHTALPSENQPLYGVQSIHAEHMHTHRSRLMKVDFCWHLPDLLLDGYCSPTSVNCIGWHYCIKCTTTHLYSVQCSSEIFLICWHCNCQDHVQLQSLVQSKDWLDWKYSCSTDPTRTLCIIPGPGLALRT